MKQNMNIQDMLREMTEMQAEDWDPPSNPDQESLTPVPEAPVRHFLMKQNVNIQDMLREMTEMQEEDWNPPSNPVQETLTPVSEPTTTLAAEEECWDTNEHFGKRFVYKPQYHNKRFWRRLARKKKEADERNERFIEEARKERERENETNQDFFEYKPPRVFSISRDFLESMAKPW